MQLSRVFFLLAFALAPVALVGTTWLYLYPLFDRGCAFPSPPNATAPAPFRLLALGDPQLEGDSSLPKAGAKIFRSFDGLVEDVENAETVGEKFDLVRGAVGGIPKDLVKALEGYVRKPIDIWGNDRYLAHVVRTLRWWTEPSHVAVLGDLLGSQWVSDEEFERRAGRYWGTLFRGMEKVPERIMTGYESDDLPRAGDEVDEPLLQSDSEDGQHPGEAVPEEQPERERKWGGTVEILGEDPAWANRVINIVGNHDIGYAGDIDPSRIARFERAFGSVNWDIVFTLPNTTVPPSSTSTSLPALRLVILNTMNIDTPAWDADLQRDTYTFINHVITTSRSVTDKSHTTVLLTHIPLHKAPGVCVDSPLFHFFDHGGVKEQNMLSEHASKIVLESIFGLSKDPHAEGEGFGRRGIIVNGHDHAGCDVLHYTAQIDREGTCPEGLGQEDMYLPPEEPNTQLDIPTGEVLQDSIAANDTLADPQAESQSELSDSDAPPEPAPESESESDSPSAPTWRAQRFPHRPYEATSDGTCIALDEVPRIREVTLRSMMGEFSGYAGFLSAWFEPGLGEQGEWKIEVSTCGLGVQHWWWAVHVVDVLLVVAVLFGGVVAAVEEPAALERKGGSAGAGKGVKGSGGVVQGEGVEGGGRGGEAGMGTGMGMGMGMRKIP